MPRIFVDGLPAIGKTSFLRHFSDAVVVLENHALWANEQAKGYQYFYVIAILRHILETVCTFRSVDNDPKDPNTVVERSTFTASAFNGNNTTLIERGCFTGTSFNENVGLIHSVKALALKFSHIDDLYVMFTAPSNLVMRNLENRAKGGDEHYTEESLIKIQQKMVVACQCFRHMICKTIGEFTRVFNGSFHTEPLFPPMEYRFCDTQLDDNVEDYVNRVILYCNYDDKNYLPSSDQSFEIYYQHQKIYQLCEALKGAVRWKRDGSLSTSEKKHLDAYRSAQNIPTVPNIEKRHKLEQCIVDPYMPIHGRSLLATPLFDLHLKERDYPFLHMCLKPFTSDIGKYDILSLDQTQVFCDEGLESKDTKCKSRRIFIEGSFGSGKTSYLKLQRLFPVFLEKDAIWKKFHGRNSGTIAALCHLLKTIESLIFILNVPEGVLVLVERSSEIAAYLSDRVSPLQSAIIRLANLYLSPCDRWILLENTPDEQYQVVQKRGRPGDDKLTLDKLTKIHERVHQAVGNLPHRIVKTQTELSTILGNVLTDGEIFLRDLTTEEPEMKSREMSQTDQWACDWIEEMIEFRRLECKWGDADEHEEFKALFEDMEERAKKITAVIYEPGSYEHVQCELIRNLLKVVLDPNKIHATEEEEKVHVVKALEVYPPHCREEFLQFTGEQIQGEDQVDGLSQVFLNDHYEPLAESEDTRFLHVPLNQMKKWLEDKKFSYAIQKFIKRRVKRKAMSKAGEIVSHLFAD